MLCYVKKINSDYIPIPGLSFDWRIQAGQFVSLTCICYQNVLFFLQAAVYLRSVEMILLADVSKMT